MLKLIFIGDKEKKNFNITNLGTCRYFYEMSFSDNKVYESLQPYLKPVNIKVSDKEREFLNSNYLFACLETKKLYKKDEVGNLYNFDIKKYEQDKKNLIVSEVKENPIPIDVIIATKDQDIIDMMKKRGCKIQQDNQDYLITPPTTLQFNKKFLDDLILDSIKNISKISTRTGLEKVIQISLTDVNTKKTEICKGKLVLSTRENKSYIVFNYDGTATYYEVWFDENGNILNDWQKENHNKLKGKNQSNRIYIWNV